MIQRNDQRYWLYATVDPDSNEVLHVGLFPTRTIILTKQFLQELTEKLNIADSLFLGDGTPRVQTALIQSDSNFSTSHIRSRDVVERLFKELKRRTEQFANHFRHATADSTETWVS